MKNFKNFSDNISNVFVRWGGANAVRQKGVWAGGKKKDGWHSPPDSRGIYAFPIKAIERFLSAHRMKERYSRIKYNDDIWHHLIDHVKRSEILEENGSWVKTEFKVWQKAFAKEILNMKLKGWDGKVNFDRDSTGKLTHYWHYYMRYKYPYINKEYCSSNDPILDARFKRHVNRKAPTKQDLLDPDFLDKSTNGDDDRLFMSYAEWKADDKGNTKGGHSGDHLEVFLPHVK